jgi:hypothetical protein
MSIAVMESVEFRESFVTSSSSREPVRQNLPADSAVATETRWLDEEDDGVAVRSYD